MLRFRPVTVLLPAMALAGCVGRAPAPPPPPSPAPVTPAPPRPPAPAPAPSATAWTDLPLTPGTWVWRTDARGAVALFGREGQEAALVVRCDRAAQRIYVSRPGTLAGPMTLRATTGAQSYAAQPTGGSPPYVAAKLGVRDPQLDALAFSRGRFLVGLQGQADVIAPAWPEFARVIEECRA